MNSSKQSIPCLKPDLHNLVKRALFVRARCKTNVLTAAETDLLLEINQGIPAQVNDRYEVLLEKRDDETLTEEEYRVPKLMDDLGIQSPGVH